MGRKNRAIPAARLYIPLYTVGSNSPVEIFYHVSVQPPKNISPEYNVNTVRLYIGGFHSRPRSYRTLFFYPGFFIFKKVA